MIQLRPSSVFYLTLSWLLFACAPSPGAVRIVGPDGTALLHVHCDREQAACFRIAGERCPHGYELSPIFDPRDGNFLVRCRAGSGPVLALAGPNALPPAASNAAAPAGDSAAPVRNAAATPAEAWPPVEVARPMEPWPAPNRTAQPGPHGSADRVDFGY